MLDRIKMNGQLIKSTKLSIGYNDILFLMKISQSEMNDVI